MRIHSLASRLLGLYLGQPFEFFLNRHSGEMTKSVLSEVNEVVNKFLLPAGQLVAGALSVIAMLVALVWVSPGIALVGFAVIGGSYALIYGALRLYLGQIGRKRVAANGERFRLAGEALHGIKDIKVIGKEAGYLCRFSKPSLRYARIQSRARVIEESPRFLLQTILFAGIVILCLVLIDRASFEGGEALGGLLPVLGAFALGGQKLMPEVQKIFAAMARMRIAAPAVANVHADMVHSPAASLPQAETVPLPLTHALSLTDLGYRYPGNDTGGLQNVSLTVARGERIGIVGSTGAGKSTLADVVLGLLRPQQGAVLVDDTSVTDENLHAWQASVGYVPQEIFLIDSSVAENIAFGEDPRRIDPQRVRTAARLAQIEAFIENDLPRGYDTLIGERGVRLSGGQRQRLGIARALYRDAELIVFDEATSALDNLTEREVMAAIDALPGDKTVLMIAHRLSTVQRCDRIVVMKRGRVVGFGGWDSLMQSCPQFRELVEIAQAA